VILQFLIQAATCRFLAFIIIDHSKVWRKLVKLLAQMTKDRASNRNFVWGTRKSNKVGTVSLILDLYFQFCPEMCVLQKKVFIGFGRACSLPRNVYFPKNKKKTSFGVTEPDQGHPRPPRNEVRGPPSPNFTKHR